MIETMYAAPGVGLAAPQVGVPLRIFVIDLSLGRDPAGLIVMVNPEFVSREGMQLEEEGLPQPPRFQRHGRAADARGRQGPESRRRRNTSAKGPNFWRARFSTRWTISTASCSSITCAVSSAT